MFKRRVWYKYRIVNCIATGKEDATFLFAKLTNVKNVRIQKIFGNITQTFMRQLLILGKRIIRCMTNETEEMLNVFEEEDSETNFWP